MARLVLPWRRLRENMAADSDETAGLLGDKACFTKNPAKLSLVYLAPTKLSYTLGKGQPGDE